MQQPQNLFFYHTFKATRLTKTKTIAFSSLAYFLPIFPYLRHCRRKPALKA